MRAPLLYSVRDVQELTGLCRASVYRLLGSGRLDGRKLGALTVVPAESLEQFIDGLPKAKVALGAAALGKGAAP